MFGGRTQRYCIWYTGVLCTELLLGSCPEVLPKDYLQTYFFSERPCAGNSLWGLAARSLARSCAEIVCTMTLIGGLLRKCSVSGRLAQMWSKRICLERALDKKPIKRFICTLRATPVYSQGELHWPGPGVTPPPQRNCLPSWCYIPSHGSSATAACVFQFYQWQLLRRPLTEKKLHGQFTLHGQNLLSFSGGPYPHDIS